MVKHTQTIRWQQLTNCLSVFDHFVKLAFKGLRQTLPGSYEDLLLDINFILLDIILH